MTSIDRILIKQIMLFALFLAVLLFPLLVQASSEEKGFCGGCGSVIYHYNYLPSVVYTKSGEMPQAFIVSAMLRSYVAEACCCLEFDRHWECFPLIYHSPSQIDPSQYVHDPECQWIIDSGYAICQDNPEQPCSTYGYGGGGPDECLHH